MINKTYRPGGTLIRRGGGTGPVKPRQPIGNYDVVPIPADVAS
jgi:hypothetical protein